MCLAYVLRFCCGHGLLMSVEPCRTGPCPFIKTTGKKLPQQPSKCLKCQQRQNTSAPQPKRLSSCTGSVDSSDSNSSGASIEPPIQPLFRSATAPLPGVALQPAGTASYCQLTTGRPRSQSAKSFSFSCSSKEHAAIYHYAGLPSFLPHQNHPCPPCQLENLKASGDQEAVALAKSEFPRLRGEMLVRNGREREDWQHTVTLESYISEKRTDEKQMWHWVIRKWTQDLKKLKILISEEDGLGLLV